MHPHTHAVAHRDIYIYIYVCVCDICSIKYTIYNIYVFSTSSVTWSLVSDIGQHIPNVSDGYNHTCHALDLESGSVLLKSDLDVPFKTLQVTVLINGGEVFFFPSTDASQCKKHTSLLMTHDSSMTTVLGRTCQPFCEVPGSCWFEEMIMLDMDVTNYRFTCVCPLASCNELFIVFKPEAVQGRISICDVQLIYS